MRFIALTLAILAVVGCRQRRDFADTYDPYDEPVGSYDPTLMVDPAFYDNVTTSELGTQTRGTAKTIDWTFGSVDEGTTYTGGMIIVDRVFRQDADDFFNVSVRLRNRDANPIKVEWKIALFNSEGTRMSGLTDWTGDKEVWHNASIESRGSTLVSNGARLKGAAVFRLQVRRSGATDEGFPEKGKDATQESIDSLKRSLGQ